MKPLDRHAGSGSFRIGTASVVLCFAALMSLSCSGPDSVFFSNTINNEVGILVDGQDAATGSEVNDRSFTSDTNFVEVGELDSSAASNAVIGFNQGRAVVVMENADWSDDTNTRVLGFDDALTLPVAVWIVYGDVTDRSLQAINGLNMAFNIFYYDAVGLDLTLSGLTDATAFPNIADYEDFEEDSDPEDWKNGVGYLPGSINMYMVHTVSGNTYTARGVNFRDVIVVGETAVEELLTHEVGHALNLRHTDGDPVNFDSTNVMWPYTANYPYDRDQFTEGQIFRMHTDLNSSLNWWIDARPGLPQYDCPHEVSNADCPAVYKRIWADNSFPPN